MKKNFAPNAKIFRLFLVGMPGSGKSTYGKKVAKLLQMPFIDLDNYIEDKSQKSILEIFEKEGEQAFRLLEQQALQAMIGFDKIIVATGGGTPCFFDNMNFINTHGYSFFLNTPLETIVQRLQEDTQNHRPLYQDKSPEELFLFLTDLYQKRRPFYEQADFFIG